MTSLVVRVCRDWLEVLSFSRLSRNDQPALTLLIVLLFAAKARKMRNPEKISSIQTINQRCITSSFCSLHLQLVLRIVRHFRLLIFTALSSLIYVPRRREGRRRRIEGKEDRRVKRGLLPRAAANNRV